MPASTAPICWRSEASLFCCSARADIRQAGTARSSSWLRLSFCDVTSSPPSGRRRGHSSCRVPRRVPASSCRRPLAALPRPGVARSSRRAESPTNANAATKSTVTQRGSADDSITGASPGVSSSNSSFLLRGEAPHFHGRDAMGDYRRAADRSLSPRARPGSETARPRSTVVVNPPRRREFACHAALHRADGRDDVSQHATHIRKRSPGCGTRANEFRALGWAAFSLVLNSDGAVVGEPCLRTNRGVLRKANRDS